MAASPEGEFNPWPAFVDIFSSVILCLLLFLMVVLANLGFFSQYKYKVSYSGSVSSSDMIVNDKKTEEATPKQEVVPILKPNADKNIQVIQEEKQMILALEYQIASDPKNIKSANGTDEIESSGINVADKKEVNTQIQTMIKGEDYFIVTYKADEFFIDDLMSKQLKDFLAKAKVKYPNLQVNISSFDIQGQLSATISKQISLARTMSVRNLIRKFGYEKKDIKIDLTNRPEIKETIDSKNGYLLIKITK